MFWIVGVGVIVALGAFFAWQQQSSTGYGDGFISANGRIEATEINLATKSGGRVDEILVNEGEFVTAGQPLVRMQTDVLQAQLDEANAMHEHARQGVASARAQVAVRESDLDAAEAVVAQRQSELEAAQRRLARLEDAVSRNAGSTQELDDERTRVLVAQATLAAAKAQAVAARAAVDAAGAQVSGALSQVAASAATVARIEVDISDTVLRAPRAGRVQYRIALPGEVLGAGGRTLNMLDLGEVYMMFFLPETVVGRVALGSEVRIVLDAAPQYVIPAKISFVASNAQFTPKTVETAEERQKLMFRVKAQIDPELVQKHLAQVKAGLPGVAWLRLESQTPWPDDLAIKVPE